MVALIRLVPLLLLLPALADAAPRCQLRGRPYLEGRVRGGDPRTSRVVEARAGEEIEVFLVLPGTLDGAPVLFSEAPGKRSFSGAGCGALSVSWYRVEPRMEHTRTPAPNGDLKIYANARVFGADHGKWLGYDRIEYIESPLPGQGATPPTLPTLIVRDAAPSPEAGVPARDPALRGLGTMRLKATATFGAQTVSTPGAEDAPAGLISPQVFRYSYRSGDDFLGWLTTFFNVPYLFGSAGQGPASQAERYLGADCADALVAALRRAGQRRMRYTSVTGLVDALRKVGPAVVVAPAAPSGPQVPDAAPRLRFGEQVRPGDLLALDYVGSEDLPRPWDHIGVVVADHGPGPDGAPDGVLGPEDLFGDTGDGRGLKFAPLGEQGIVRVQVLRP